MKRALLLFLALATAIAGAQVERIEIKAGTPEDHALQAITAEKDTQKRMAMLQEFVEKFSSNPQAVAYGNWQLAQQYLDKGEPAKAMPYADKAATSQPRNMEILVLLASVAEKLKDTDKIVDSAVRGGTAFNGIASQTKPEGMAADDFALRIKQKQDLWRTQYEYLAAVGLNAMSAEPDAKKRMGYIERYIAAFPGSGYQDRAMQLAVYTLSQLNDPARMASFADKAVAANPNSVSLLAVLAAAFAESSAPGSEARAEDYAHKALAAVNGQAAGKDDQQMFYSGLAHSALGYALMKQGKTAPAIVELKAAVEQVKGHPDVYSVALYRLGFAYAKTGKLKSAKTVLTELTAIQGPYQKPGQDLLVKVNAGLAKARRRR